MSKGGCESITNSALIFDQFGQNIKFKFPDGRTTRKSGCGCMLSLVLLGVLLAFAIISFGRVWVEGTIIESV